jgi:hypothetical protein
MNFDVVAFVREDWQKIPSNLRYLIYMGFSLVFMSWLYDHWGTNPPVVWIIQNFSVLAFNAGLWLLIVSFVAIFARQVWLFWTTQRLRVRYPLNRLNDDFHLVSLGGKVYLFDTRQGKKKYHIRNWQTMIDLGFEYEVTIVTDPSQKEVQVKNGVVINIDSFVEIPGGIKTQGLTGS